MDKQAFKQRMQNLKSYRENNPGKGYWDWKVQSFENGGEVTRTGKESLNSFKKKLFNSNFDNLKKIFNSYKSGKQFIDDFNMIPITATNNNSDSILV